MSETLIQGYVADLERLRGLPLCGDRVLLQRLLSDHQELLENVGHRFYEGDDTLHPERALEMLLIGPIDSRYALALQCALEVVLEEVAEKLEDETEECSLWFNLAFGVDDFTPVFRRLGLSYLAQRWLDGTVPMQFVEQPVEWPTFTTLDRPALERLRSELGQCDLERLDELPDALFLTRGEPQDLDDLRGTMRENVEELTRWVTEACEAPADRGLVLFYDGER